MNPPLTYEIVIRGRASDRILGPLLDDFALGPAEPGHTRLTGVIRDPAHLHGVVAHLSSVAIDIVSVTPTDAREPLTNQPSTPTERQDK